MPRKKMRLLLSEWAAREFSKPPCRQVLYKWAKLGYISPPPVIIGRAYYVKGNACFVGPEIPATQNHRLLTKKAPTSIARLIDRIK